jgi:mannose-1-phosphate guanylyltransferase
MDGCVINSYSYIDNSIIGWRCKIGRWSRIENHSLLGEDVNIADEISLNNTIVLPNVALKTSNTGSTILC